MINTLSAQIERLRSGIKSSNSPNQKKQGFIEIIRVAERMAWLFEKKNRQFLIDSGFLRKVEILLEYEKQQEKENLAKEAETAMLKQKKGGTPLTKYSEAIKIYKRDVLDPFYSKIESIVSRNFNIDPQTIDKDELEIKREQLLDKLSNGKEKLYALYNNKIGIMDLLNQTTIAIYLLKGMRVFFAWFAIYMASKIMQEKYVSQVFANNTDPPDLRMFVMYFWGVEMIFMVALLVFLGLIKFLFDRQGDFIINGTLIRKYVMDYLIGMVFVLALGIAISSVIQQKKYYRYRVDGLRAIRSLQDIMIYLVVVISVIPFFIIL